MKSIEVMVTDATIGGRISAIVLAIRSHLVDDSVVTCGLTNTAITCRGKTCVRALPDELLDWVYGDGGPLPIKFNLSLPERFLREPKTTT